MTQLPFGPRPPGPPAPPEGPERPERPADLVLSVRIWIFVIVAMAASLAAQILLTADDNLRSAYHEFESSQQMKDARAQGVAFDFEQFRTMAYVVWAAMIGFGVVVGGALVLLLAKGKGWARPILDFAGALVLAVALLTLVSSHEPYVAVPAILGGVAALGALMMMHTADSTAFLFPGRSRR
ncbi:hypothetical protein P0W64_19465 [Tsukamurella sp. 8F]|uniref:hypothetical protein n=1 Tax=unclassified Tsukamurella TaxID=2633480 RepID=UPI0023B8935F|nr:MULTISPECIES: hypothetical protein [unclassified Tsukamurella]MDF0531720.1 hypothetical protein [Tsukamurella sp. 8J]MDF0588966.1 hypothetical protein [Tsukamurella sp. 8F]